MEQNLGKEIKRLRLKAGFTLRFYAQKVGISAAHLSDIEHSRRLPSEDLLDRIVTSLAHVGASRDCFRLLDTRIDTETKEWINATPGAHQILRMSKESGKSVHDILEILRKSLMESENKDDSNEV